MRAAAFLLVGAVLGGCTSQTAHYESCVTGIPASEQLLADPAFAPLTYHKVNHFEQRRGYGYSTWADSKFEFRNALEYLLVRRPGGKTDDDMCSYGISLRVAVPAQQEELRRLAVFARSLAPAIGKDPAALERELAAVLASNDKFRDRSAGATPMLEAGRLAHPSRGDFFMVKVTWPKPGATAK